VTWLELPDAGVRLKPAGADRVDGDLGRTPVFDVQAVACCRRSQQEQDLAEVVQLELVVDPVAGHVPSSGVPHQVDRVLVGHSAPGDRISRLERRAVAQNPPGDEPNRRTVEQREGAAGGDSPTGVALVPYPGVAVVVVASLVSALGQRHRRCRHHRAGRTGHPSSPA